MSRLIALVLCALIPAAVHAAAPAESYQWASPVKTDANLYRIDDKLYRSEQLTRADAPQLAELGIKSVVNLRYFDRNDNDTALAGHGLALLNKPLLAWRVTPRQIAETLYLIEQR